MGGGGGILAGWATAAGAGALVGLTGGAARAGLEIRAHHELSQGTLWLAWARLSRQAAEHGASGGALALAAALILCLLPPARRALAGAPRVRAAHAGLLLLALLAAATALEGVTDRLRAGDRPSVVLVSIDTLRGDRLVGTDGARVMPRLHALAEEGAVFTDAMATAPWTLPSHASVFTSLLPYDHGARSMKGIVGRQHALLAERFRDAGYRTAAFTGGVYVGSSFGFAQGFDTYEDHDEEKEGGPGLLLRRALEWVRGRGDAPFFLFVHTYQPHIPYRSPAGDRGGRVPFPFTVVHAEESYAGRRILTEEERGEVRALYDADVRATDEAIGGFLQALRGDGVLDRAILVVLSDHGEDLWDRPSSRAPGHGHALYQELLHVPLLVRAPGLVPAGGRLRSPVSLLDVAPTLLDLCRLPADPRHRGRSLGPVLRGGREFPPLPQVAEAVEYGPERFTLRDGALKVILADPRVLHHGVRLPFLPLEVYDLARDPAESDPRSGRSSPGLRRALALLQERQWRGEEGRPVERAGEVPADVREQLRSLGYVR